MTKTYQECFEFFRAASQWLSKNEEESKFKYALTKVNRKVQRLQDKYQAALEEINIECCATDKEGVILRDQQGQYKYTKDELKKRNRKANELFRSEVEIEPHLATEAPENLTDLEKEVFEGFVLKEGEEPKIAVVA